MFGKILEITKNKIVMANNYQEVYLQYIGVHLVFEEDERKLIGKIINITKDKIEAVLLGEIVSNRFIPGIYKAPTLKQLPRIVNAQELELLIGKQNYNSKDILLLGNSTVYEKFKVTANLNCFFSNHFAIIGNSGFGKSCGAARIFQNIFYYNEVIPKNAHIVLFDAYGEYEKAFSKVSTIPDVNVKVLKAFQGNYINQIVIPPYLLDADDFAILLQVTDPSLISILEKALQYVNIFKSNDPIVNQTKNEMIANCLLEVLASGKNSAQIRDQIISILNKYHTEELNLESVIKEPGYFRTIKQCLNIDNQGKMNAIALVIDFLTSFQVSSNMQTIPTGYAFTLEDLYDALEFALLSEGIYNNVSMYERASSLKIKLHQIIEGPYNNFFRVDKHFTRKEFVETFFQTPDGKPVQIVDLQLNMIDDRFAKMVTKIYAKLFFQYGTNQPNRGSFPIHIILEEAHRYVNNDHDIDIIGYNIFDRITKEGRKYGILMGFITQRPSELSKTVLSQCSNFFVFRIFHPDDFYIIDSITSSITRDELEQLKTLRAGTALAFGNALSLPTMVSLDLPDPPPDSSNVNITEVWYN